MTGSGSSAAASAPGCWRAASGTAEGGRRASGQDRVDARAELRWRPTRWLRSELSVDAAAGKPLRDPFLELRLDGWAIRVLQFKQPYSTIEPEPDSRWDPPGSNTAAQLVAIKGEEP